MASARKPLGTRPYQPYHLSDYCNAQVRVDSPPALGDVGLRSGFRPVEAAWSPRGRWSVAGFVGRPWSWFGLSGAGGCVWFRVAVWVG